MGSDMNELKLLILFIFALGNLWHFYPGYWNHSKDINENHVKNSKEILNRKTKTRTKSKILPTGDLVEQTVITEVTETFSSPNCASDAVVKKLVDHDNYDAENESLENEETTLETRKNDSKGSSYNNKEKLKGTGLSCRISHLVVHHSHQWKFHLVGINSSPPLYCGPSQGPCLYTRESKPGQDNDSNVYCFSSSNCVNKITQLHRVTPKLVKVEPHHLQSQAENEKLSNLSPVKRLEKVKKTEDDQGACCPIKESLEGPIITAIFVLKYKIPRKETQCNDNCVYTKSDLSDDIEFCFGHQEKNSKMKTVCRRSMPVFESLFDSKSESGVSFSIESAIPLRSKAGVVEQTAHALPYKLKSNGSQFSNSVSEYKNGKQLQIVEEKEENKTNQKTIVLEVKPLRLNQQILDVKKVTTHADNSSKREKKDTNVPKQSGKHVPDKDTKHPESKEKNKECTKKESFKSISKQEAPKRIVRSESHEEEKVQIKFTKTTYEDPVQ